MFPTSDREAPVVISFGPYRVDRATGALRRDGQEIPLPPKVFGVLWCLADRQGELVSKEDLLEAVWDDAAVTDASITEAIRKLRNALGDDPQEPTYVQTVHRRGYRFIAETRVTVGPTGADSAGEAESTGGRSAHPRDHLPPSAVFRRHPRLAAAAIGSVALVALAAWYLAAGAPARPWAGEEPFFFPVEAPEGWKFFSQTTEIAISPDGSLVAYQAVNGADGWTLWVRGFDGRPARLIEGSVGRMAREPFFSADGSRVGYVAASRGIDVVDLDSGAVSSACTECFGPTRRTMGASFGPDDEIVFARDEADATGIGLWRIPPGSGKAVPIPEPAGEPPDTEYLWPRFLPDSEWMIVTLKRGWSLDGARLAALHMRTGEAIPLVEDGYNGRYVASGHLLFGRAGELWAVGFDPRAMEVTGEPFAVPLETPIAMEAMHGRAGFDVAENGTLVYFPGLFHRSARQVVIVSMDGTRTPLLNEVADFRYPRVSPDGSMLAVCVRENREHVRIYDLRSRDPHRREVVARLAPMFQDACHPVWSPNSAAIAYSVAGDGIWAVDARQFAEPVHLVSPPGYFEPTQWLEGGIVVYTVDADDLGFGDEMQVRAVDIRAPEPFDLIPGSERESFPAVSPDGNWIAYAGPGGQILLLPRQGGPAMPLGAGRLARWSPGGERLFVYRNRGRWGEVTTPGAADLQPGSWTRLDIDVSANHAFPLADGSGFVDSVSVAESPPTTEFIVARNWLGVLEGRNGASR